MISSTQKSSGPTVSYNDLEMAYSFASSSDDIEAAAYICRKTGNVYWDSSGLDDDVDVPDDVGDSSLFASVPGQRELDLGSQLVFRFIRRKLPVHYDRVSNMFHRRGAYRLYKDFLNSQGKLEEWYAFENSETESALRAWAEEEGFTVLPEVILEQPKRVYQFKVELEEIKPAIWRRIQVPENYNFWELHVAIQDAMGWLDYHLHVSDCPKKMAQPRMLSVFQMMNFRQQLQLSPDGRLGLSTIFMKSESQQNTSTILVMAGSTKSLWKASFSAMQIVNTRSVSKVNEHARRRIAEECPAITDYSTRSPLRTMMNTRN